MTGLLLYVLVAGTAAVGYCEWRLWASYKRRNELLRKIEAAKHLWPWPAESLHPCDCGHALIEPARVLVCNGTAHSYELCAPVRESML